MQYLIERLYETHYESIINLSNDLFGEDYINENDLSEFSQSLVLKDPTQVLGFILFKPFEKGEFQWSNIASIETFFENSNIIIMIKSLAVKKEFQNKGFGTILINELLHSVPVFTGFVLSAWKYGNTMNLLGLIEKFQFIHLYHIEHFWFDESLLKKYKCAICGSPPCVCDAEIFGFVKTIC